MQQNQAAQSQQMDPLNFSSYDGQFSSHNTANSSNQQQQQQNPFMEFSLASPTTSTLARVLSQTSRENPVAAMLSVQSLANTVSTHQNHVFDEPSQPAPLPYSLSNYFDSNNSNHSNSNSHSNNSTGFPPTTLPLHLLSNLPPLSDSGFQSPSSGGSNNTYQNKNRQVASSSALPNNVEKKNSTPRKVREESSEKDPKANAKCANCGITKTPLWRRGEDGSTLCNKCGLYWSRHGEQRPLKLDRTTIQRGNGNGNKEKKQTPSVQSQQPTFFAPSPSTVPTNAQASSANRQQRKKRSASAYEQDQYKENTYTFTSTSSSNDGFSNMATSMESGSNSNNRISMGQTVYLLQEDEGELLRMGTSGSIQKPVQTDTQPSPSYLDIMQSLAALKSPSTPKTEKHHQNHHVQQQQQQHQQQYNHHQQPNKLSLSDIQTNLLAKVIQTLGEGKLATNQQHQTQPAYVHELSEYSTSSLSGLTNDFNQYASLNTPPSMKPSQTSFSSTVPDFSLDSQSKNNSRQVNFKTFM